MTRSYETELPGVAAGILQLARMKAGMSQRELAERAGVPSTMISAYERGLRDPTVGTLLRLVRAAGLDLRFHLEPADPHDDVLEAMEHSRSQSERDRRDGEIDLWRGAHLVSTVTSN